MNEPTKVGRTDSPSSARPPIVAANWKMNLLRAEATDFCRQLVADYSSLGDPGADVIIFPSFPLLDTVAAGLADRDSGTVSRVDLGGQDLHPADRGAHTGDTSAAQLADARCRWVLVGHSERRADHGETDRLVAEKVAAALRHGLRPMICVGESEDQRESGETESVLERQLAAVVPALQDADDGTEFALAYEPIWAIGTGKTATPELAQKAHRFLRSELERHLGADLARTTRVLYGGSAKPDNAAALIAEPDLDGFLVGGASLDPNSFLAIIRTVGETAGPETEV